MKNVKIVTFVPPEHADAIRDALGKAGAGALGSYRYCSFSFPGTGRYIPDETADPHEGEPGKLSVVDEERIEVICEREKAKGVIRAMKEAHPYEEVAFDILPLLDEDEL